MDINNIYFGLEPEKKERLEKIEVILEQIPMTDKSFDNAYTEFREIISSTGHSARVVSIEDRFSKLFRDAKDRLNFQFVSFYGL